MAANRIVLIARGGRQYDEGKVAAAFKPGHLIKMDSNGEYLKHATAVREAERLIAIEDALQGKTIVDAYAIGDVVRFHIAVAGDVLYMRLAAAALAVVKGDQLVSAGDGTIKKVVTAATDNILAVAMEAVDNSAGGAEVFLKIRIV